MRNKLLFLRFTPRSRLNSILLVLLGLCLFLPAANGVRAMPQSDAIANLAFVKLYNQTGLGAELWGNPYAAKTETFLDSPDLKRQVQYFDYGRMELSHPDILPEYVSSGKLVLEMLTGRMQVADAYYYQYSGSEKPILGGAANSKVSYRSMQSLSGGQVASLGSRVSRVLTEPQDEGDFSGIYKLETDTALGNLAFYQYYAPETGHNVADKFWNYINQPGANGLPAFNWRETFGLPITDAYWLKNATSGTNGEPLEALIQLFEKRVLYYLPSAGLVRQVAVGVDYFSWRYAPNTLPTYDEKLIPPLASANSRQTPTVGESGTIFKLEASGFAPGETVDRYARLSPDGGVYATTPLIADSKGVVRRNLTTRPVEFPTTEYYFALTGRQSGEQALWHVKVIDTIRFTPGTEAAQPDSVPPGKNAEISPRIFSVGTSAVVKSNGFKPNEYLKGWITTPLRRVVGYAGLINSVSAVGFFPALIQADERGNATFNLPAPGSVVPGIYAYTIYGSQSGKTAIAYFRVQAGLAVYTSRSWGNFDREVTPPSAVEREQAASQNLTRKSLADRLKMLEGN